MSSVSDFNVVYTETLPNMIRWCASNGVCCTVKRAIINLLAHSIWTILSLKVLKMLTDAVR